MTQAVSNVQSVGHSSSEMQANRLLRGLSAQNSNSSLGRNGSLEGSNRILAAMGMRDTDGGMHRHESHEAAHLVDRKASTQELRDALHRPVEFRSYDERKVEPSIVGKHAKGGYTPARDERDAVWIAPESSANASNHRSVDEAAKNTAPLRVPSRSPSNHSRTLHQMASTKRGSEIAINN